MIDFGAARLNMVESQLRPNKVTDQAVLDAFLAVPRERFVPPALRRHRLCRRRPAARRRPLPHRADGAGAAAAAGRDRPRRYGARDRRRHRLRDGDRRPAGAQRGRRRERRRARRRAPWRGSPNSASAMSTVIEGALGARLSRARALSGRTVRRRGRRIFPTPSPRQVAEDGRIVAVLGDGNGTGRAVLMTRSSGVHVAAPGFRRGAAALAGLRARAEFRLLSRRSRSDAPFPARLLRHRRGLSSPPPAAPRPRR